MRLPLILPDDAHDSWVEQGFHLNFDLLFLEKRCVSEASRVGGIGGGSVALVR